MPLDGAILGEGIYTPREAARLIGGTAQEVLRWTRGSGPREPLWKAHYQFLDDTSEISFHDLVELRVVRALRERASLQAIRFAIRLAQQKFGVDRPLSSLQFKTDGGEILMEALEGDGELVSLSRRHPGQKVFRDIVGQSVSGLEYDGGQILRWRPVNSKHVVIDPQRAFGSPVLDECGISTSAIYAEYRRSQSFKYVGRLFEIETSMVRDAVAYEDYLSNQAGRSVGQGTI